MYFVCYIHMNNQIFSTYSDNSYNSNNSDNSSYSNISSISKITNTSDNLYNSNNSDNSSYSNISSISKITNASDKSDNSNNLDNSCDSNYSSITNITDISVNTGIYDLSLSETESDISSISDKLSNSNVIIEINNEINNDINKTDNSDISIKTIDTVCPICLDNFNKDRYNLSCNHAYHYKCIKMHYNRNMINGISQCPMCRRQIIEKLHKITTLDIIRIISLIIWIILLILYIYHFTLTSKLYRQITNINCSTLDIGHYDNYYLILNIFSIFTYLSIIILYVESNKRLIIFILHSICLIALFMVQISKINDNITHNCTLNYYYLEHLTNMNITVIVISCALLLSKSLYWILNMK